MESEPSFNTTNFGILLVILGILTCLGAYATSRHDGGSYRTRLAKECCGRELYGCYVFVMGLIIMMMGGFLLLVGQHPQ